MAVAWNRHHQWQNPLGGSIPDLSASKTIHMISMSECVLQGELPRRWPESLEGGLLDVGQNPELHGNWSQILHDGMHSRMKILDSFISCYHPCVKMCSQRAPLHDKNSPGLKFNLKLILKGLSACAMYRLQDTAVHEHSLTVCACVVACRCHYTSTPLYCVHVLSRAGVITRSLLTRLASADYTG